MILKGWRRFRPRQTGRNTGDVFERVGVRLEQVLETVYGRGWPNVRVEQLPEAINTQRQIVSHNNDAVEWIVLLILQAPRAARAQEQMDRHHHGYRGREARLYELIDFNDAYVSSVLSLPGPYLPGFTNRAREEVNRFCEHVGARSFSDEQWEAITRGLSREVAVYRGAIAAGFSAEMTDRRSDALGVDMIIHDPETGRAVNIDCKTPSSYFLRLQELAQEGRLTEKQAIRADAQGHCMIVNGQGSESREIVLFRVSPEVFGEVEDFSFSNQPALGAVLRQVIIEYGHEK